MRLSFFYNILFIFIIYIAPNQAIAAFLNSQSDLKFEPLTKTNEVQFLAVDEAFEFNFQQQSELLTVNWTIAPQYYLYKDKVQLIGNDVQLGEWQFPPSLTVEDEYFGISSVYRKNLTLSIPISNIGEQAEIKIRYQGCADAGLCYPPTTKVFPLIYTKNQLPDTNNDQPLPLSHQDQLANKLASNQFLLTLLSFFILGIGLAFTPCVFPMYPILSGIIAGRCNKITTKQAFILSFCYIQGMALTYSALGLIVASAGVKFQAYFQHPMVLIGLSLIFVILALSMFGWFELSLPTTWQQKMNEISNHQQGGQLKGVFIMGAISGLVASPCTTAPLSGVLLYVAQSGDLLIGGITLYVLSMGMGVPLLILGASGGRWLPKAGKWMEQIKIIFGFVLLAVPLILLERIIEIRYIITIAALLVLIIAAYLYNLQLNIKQTKIKTALTFSALLMTLGSTFTIYQHWFNTPSLPVTAKLNDETHGFINIASLSELHQQLQIAKSQNQPVMVDLYADWCVACKEFEKYTFTNPMVQQQMNQFMLLRADVTRNTDTDIELLEAYSVMGLPTLLFFDKQSIELSQQRVTGFMNAEKFNQHLIQLLH